MSKDALLIYYHSVFFFCFHPAPFLPPIPSHFSALLLHIPLLTFVLKKEKASLLPPHFKSGSIFLFYGVLTSLLTLCYMTTRIKVSVDIQLVINRADILRDDVMARKGSSDGNRFQTL